ncbi:hypothetical protein COU59_02125 [Candidatus Pacearchaeota archaeon CG10_big_fil_rev_8_21_14_0_10_34_12]|nr:MAG: hypothetical protein COU59_02125 [Candidatus Pacearchaeota archaeon CG10_big_fil_rev_8_21_14_0_10_34_12]
MKNLKIKMAKEFESTVLETKNLTDSVKLIRFSLPEQFTFIPGQYLSVTRIAEGKKLRTPYSIASPCGKNFGEFCVKVINVGKTSSYLNTLKKGDKLELFGPFGRFTIDENSKPKDLIFISSGTGISVFASMIPSLLAEGFSKKIILIKGFRTENEILYDMEFQKLGKKYPNFEFHNVLSQPKEKEFENKGHVQDFLDKIIPSGFKGDFYLCGLSEMIEDVKNKLKTSGIPEKRIFYESYD